MYARVVSFLIPSLLAACVIDAPSPNRSPEKRDGRDGGHERPASSCLGAEVLEVIGTHVNDLVAGHALIAGHADPDSAVQVFALPGWNVSTANYAFMIAACEEAEMAYDVYCDGTACWQLSCPGTPDQWAFDAWLDGAPVAHDGWTYEDGASSMTYPGSGDAFDGQWSMQATDANGLDWTMTGESAYAEGALLLEERYEGIGVAPVTVSFARAAGDPEGHGWIQVDGEEVAQLSLGGEHGEDGHGAVIEAWPSGACGEG